MALDPRSLIAMGGIMALLMAVVLAVMRRHYPKNIQGLGLWAGAPAVWLVATVLFSGRDQIAPLLSVVGANTLLMLGAVLFHAGCQLFFGHTVRWRMWGAYLALFAIAFAWLPSNQTSYSVRLLLFTALMAGVYAANLLFLLRHGTPRLPVRMVQITLAAHIAVLLLRFATGALGMVGQHLLETSLLQTLYIGSYVLTILILSIGAVLMASDRLVTELEHLATHDPLTRTLNRRAILQHFEDELVRSERTGKGPALLLLDLDHFKAINDHYGHQHGDAVLLHFAQSTQAVLRRADRLGRYGGEEFVVLLPETNALDAEVAAERIHSAMATGHALDCPLSIGLTAWLGPGDTPDAMLSRADKALYQAKANGRNQTCIG